MFTKCVGSYPVPTGSQKGKCWNDRGKNEKQGASISAPEGGGRLSRRVSNILPVIILPILEMVLWSGCQGRNSMNTDRNKRRAKPVLLFTLISAG